MKAVLLISHGSRFPEAKREALELIERLRRKGQGEIFECAFLEIESPNIPEGIDLCVHEGATEIVVLLNFLNSGRHVLEDIPNIVNQAKTKYPNVTIRLTQPIGQHPQIERLFLDMIAS